LLGLAECDQAQQAPTSRKPSRGAMQAASALLANALLAPVGEAGAAPDAGGADAFTSALAALMGVLGQAQPAADPTSAAPAGGQGGGPAVGASGGAPAAFLPTAAGSAGGASIGVATASTAAAMLSGSTTGLDGGLLADALQALAALEAGQPAVMVASPDAAPTSAGTAATNPAMSPTTANGASDAPAPEDALLALLSDLASGANGDAAANADPASTSAQAGAGPPASSSDPALDPRLIRFTARGVVTMPSDASGGADAASAAANDAAAVTAQGEQPAAAAQGQPGADAAQAPPPPALPANAAAAGLVVFNPAGQPAPLAAPTQPPGSRSNATRATAAAPVGAGAPTTPVSLAPDLRVATAALTADARDDADIAPAGDDASQPGAGGGQGSGDGPDAGPDAGPGAAAFQLAAAPGAAAAPVGLPPAAAAALAHAHGAEITAQLAAQIASQSGKVRSSFDFSLDPQGLGRVDVSLKIDAQGGLSAVLSFDNPAVAAEARSRAGDLQQVLQQAGFDVSQSGLSFTSGGGQGQGAAFQGAGQPTFAGPTFADPGPPELPAISATRAAGSQAGGLDITI
jgi:hypothetical protein